LFQVLLIGGSTGTMLEALDVVGGDNHSDGSLASVGPITVSFARKNVFKTYFCLFLVCVISLLSFLFMTFTLKLHLEVTPIVNVFGR
jgi:hypothetical protein